MLGMLLGALILIIRLIQLQFVQESSLATQSQKNFLRLEKITPPRGNIIDRNGLLLATNRPITVLYWQGTGNRKLTQTQVEHIHTIESILGISLIPDQKAHENFDFIEHRYKQILIANDISLVQLGKIKELFADNKNIVLFDHFKRFYPYNAYASHALGYLGYINDLEMAGKMGLEKELEPALKGTAGTRVKQVNSVGKQLESEELQEPAAGKDIHTTLDIRIQHILETIFPPDQTGTIIVMDPQEGDIIALLSRPNFDPGLFVNPIEANIWQGLQENQPFINRAFQGCYPPGSLFKLVSLSAALEKNIIRPDSTWYCRGYTTFCNRTYRCHHKAGHGTVNTTQALAQSCNIPFYEIGKHIDIDVLADYAHRFGLGQKTNSLFPEKNGLIPSRVWKKEVIGERWHPGETLSAIIGQSFSLVTPMQICCMISGIVTGYLVKPRLLMTDPVQTQPLEIKKSTLDFLRQAMHQVVTCGTGQRVSSVHDFQLYGKTSTAQTCDLSKQDLGKKYWPHGWFATYLTYKNNSPLTIVILLEHAGSSRVATAVAKQFLLAYKKMIDAGPDAPFALNTEQESLQGPLFDIHEFEVSQEEAAA
jgi:penicillin-binding protein 2